MRKVICLLLILVAVAIFLCRQRLFLRDPLGKVEVNGKRLQRAEVFINYSNDVLAFTDEATDSVIVQGWDRTPGHPQLLACARGLACLAPSDHAPKLPLKTKRGDRSVFMGDREVRYGNETGDWVRVIIR